MGEAYMNSGAQSSQRILSPSFFFHGRHNSCCSACCFYFEYYKQSFVNTSEPFLDSNNISHIVGTAAVKVTFSVSNKL